MSLKVFLKDSWIENTYNEVIALSFLIFLKKVFFKKVGVVNRGV